MRNGYIKGLRAEREQAINAALNAGTTQPEMERPNVVRTTRTWVVTAEWTVQAEELVHDIPGFDPYDAFVHWNVINDYELKEDENDPETHAWHLENLKAQVDRLIPGWQAIPAAALNKAEKRAEGGIVYQGPWVFHPLGDGGDHDPALEGEYWETLCKVIARK